MRKIFVSAVFLICMVFSMTANAETLYGGDVSDIIQGMKMVGNQFGFSVWGTEYYTYQGVKRCELHFGQSQNNLVRFRLNNNNSVARMLVSVPNSYNSSSEMVDMMHAGMLAGVCCIASGVDENEYQSMWDRYMQDCIDNAYSDYMHKKYSIWSARAQQYIVVDVEMNSSKVDFYFYVD